MRSSPSLASPELPFRGEPFRVPFSSIPKKTVRHIFHFLHGSDEANCQKRPGLIDAIGKSGPSSIGGLREAVGGRTSRKDSRLYRRKTVRMITVRNNDYVTHEASVKPGILAIDSPLHRLWRSFPRWGTLDNFDGVHFSSYAQFPLTGFAGAPLSREPFRVPFSSIPKKTVRHKSHFLHGTYEAHCQKLPGIIDSIGKSVALLSASPKFGQSPKATEGLYYRTSRK